MTFLFGAGIGILKFNFFKNPNHVLEIINIYRRHRCSDPDIHADFKNIFLFKNLAHSH